ncbi:MAG: hypothetical protein DDG59_14120 [Anaerolineae bacterium]|jgi:hypothetical protein|nr:MAG: hypothetical protein DDG59_14120 [Anaerolineae bacterium]
MSVTSIASISIGMGILIELNDKSTNYVLWMIFLMIMANICKYWFDVRHAIVLNSLMVVGFSLGNYYIKNVFPIK